MKLKELESRLQCVRGFSSPKLHLEQYETPSHIAAQMLHSMDNSYGDISGCAVADLGCGCGMLTVGAGLLDASFVCGFELDTDALNISWQNIQEAELTSVDLVQADVTNLTCETSKNDPVISVPEYDLKLWPKASSHWVKKFDTVVLNPPFGTKQNHGTDLAFLAVACHLACHCVYSLHKTTTRDHVVRAVRRWGVKAEVVAELRYDLPATYKFHKRNSVDVRVDFMRFQLD